LRLWNKITQVVNAKEKVTVFMNSGAMLRGVLEDTAPRQRVVAKIGDDRVFGFLVDGRVFQEPKEGEIPMWSSVPLVSGKIVTRDDDIHHWVPALHCFVESETGSKKKFIKGVEVTVQKFVLENVPDFEYRIKKLAKYAEKKANVRQGWKQVEKTDTATKVTYDAVMVARVIDLGLSALELVVQVTKAIEAIVGVSSIFGLKGSIKAKFDKKVKAIELRENELS
jgi:hypothetical protein